MKTWIKTSIASALIATTALGSAAVLARGGDCDGFGPTGAGGGWGRMAPEQMAERMSDRAEQRLARLELALALKPEQQAAWNTFKGEMTDRAERMATQMQTRMQAERPKTAIERLERREEMSKLRQAGLADTRKAVETFYATLSDAQKTVFDTEFQPMGRGGRHGMGHGGYGRGMSHGDQGSGMGPGRG